MNFPNINSNTEKRDFVSFIKWFENTSESIIFNEEENIRRALFSEMIHKVSNLLKFQKRLQNFKHNEKNLVVSSPDSKRRKINFVKRSHLPDEIMLKIINNMQTKDVFGNFALACKRFNILTKDPSALKFLHLKGIKKDSHYKSIMSLIKTCRKLKEIKIEKCAGSSHANYLFELLLTSSNKLEKLKIMFDLDLEQKCIQVPILSYSKLIQKNYLLELEMRNCRLEYEKNDKLSQFMNVKSQTIAHGQYWSKADDLIAIAKSCKNLEHITFTRVGDLNSSHLNDKSSVLGFNELFLERRQTLKSLTIEKFSSRPDGDGPSSFMKNMTLCENLQEIRILDARVLSTFGLNVIANIQKLELLELIGLHNSSYYNNLNNDGLKTFLNNLNTDNLKFLTISDTSMITEENFEIFCKKRCPMLEKLNFDKCPKLKINDHMLKTLVGNCPSLKSIQFTWRSISETSTKLLNKLSKSMIIFVAFGDYCLSYEDFVKVKKGMTLK